MKSVALMWQKPLGLWTRQWLSDLPSIDLRAEFIDLGIERSGWWNGGDEHHDLPDAWPINSTCATFEDFLALAADCDLLLCVQGSHIIPASFLASFPGLAYNVHLAPLPRYRGWFGPSHAILEQCSQYSATIHDIVAGVDQGGVRYSQSMKVSSEETAHSLYLKAEEAARGMIQKAVGDLVNGRIPDASPQDNSEARFFGRSSLDSYRVANTDMTLNEICIRARALWFPPHPPLIVQDGELRFCVGILPASDLDPHAVSPVPTERSGRGNTA